MSLQRFTEAQDKNYQDALQEIKQGKKRTHWMWYVFPQLKDLGRSETALYYGIADLAEATGYLNDKVLGERLIAISKALLQLPGNDAHEIFGSPDDLKLLSSMTLFALVPDTDPVFESVLEKFFDGERDANTIRIING